ncbi:hypothetical protein [Methyloglobulus sp.]|uniref:hypothetical protein n=1 Tax=Methyloglobulus sp. TaxID=2518622 RepID=UPI0032B73C1D
MKISRMALGSSALTVLFALSASIGAVEKPKSMDDMWKIIQAQQQEIEAMKAQMNGAKVSEQPPVANVASASVKKLERKTDVLSQEVEKLRTNLAIPEEAKYKSAYGLGPAASKIYQVGKGLSIGGYGEANYQAFVGDKGKNVDNADMERLVLYAGYKFTDNILFNSEIEFEHATTGEGSEEKGEVSVEFAALDFFIDPLANIRAGLVLMPMGFINQIHEPPFFFGNNRPEVERRIIPSTWREVGVGLFGQITPELTYTTYVVNGLNAAEFSSNGIRDGRGGGSQAKAENFGYVARMDYAPEALPGVSVGGSAYVGNSGQNQTFAGKNPDVLVQLYEGHAQWKYRGLEWRALGSWGHINNADILSAESKRLAGLATANGVPTTPQTIGSENYGWYTEVGYDILPLIFKDTAQYLAPFFRYEQFDTIAKVPDGSPDDENMDRHIYQFGLQYKPIPNVVIKADYRNIGAKKGSVPDDFNLGFGFIF